VVIISRSRRDLRWRTPPALLVTRQVQALKALIPTTMASTTYRVTQRGDRVVFYGTLPEDPGGPVYLYAMDLASERSIRLAPGTCPSPKTDPTRKPCSIRALANEMNQVKRRVKIAADNHVTQRYVPPRLASRFSRTARYRCGNVGLSSRSIFGEPQPWPLSPRLARSQRPDASDTRLTL
jgi:hypothetical protein